MKKVYIALLLSLLLLAFTNCSLEVKASSKPKVADTSSSQMETLEYRLVCIDGRVFYRVPGSKSIGLTSGYTPIVPKLNNVGYPVSCE